MAGTLGSYNTAVSGMDVARRGLSVTGHNLSNANSIGYTRQQSISMDSFYHTVGTNQFGRVTQNLQIGTGTDYQEIRQIRNQFLDIAYRKENTKAGYYNAKQKSIAEIESVFSEFQDSGLQYVMNQFYNSLHEVEKDPSSLAARGLLKNRAIEFVSTVNYMYTQLEKKQEDINLQISNKVKEVNQTALKIAELNIQISGAEAAGDRANDLRDQRNLLIDNLSKMIKIQTTENAQGKVTILFANGTLVSGEKVNQLTTAVFADSEGGDDKSGAFIYPVWEYKQTEPIYFDKGEIAGLLEIRGTFVGSEFVTGANDQWKNGSLETDALDNVVQPQKDIAEFGFIPKMKRQLNVLVNAIVEGINSVVTQCYDLKGDLGIPLFTTKDGSGGVIQANNIEFNKEITDLDKIAIAKTAAKGDGSGAFAILELRRKTDGITFEKDGKIYNYTYDNFYNQLITDLGNEGQQVNGAAESQATLMNQMSNERARISGVSEDEELQNMMVFQHAYNASARVFNAIDEMVDRIVNHLKR